MRLLGKWCLPYAKSFPYDNIIKKMLPFSYPVNGESPRYGLPPTVVMVKVRKDLKSRNPPKPTVIPSNVTLNYEFWSSQFAGSR